MEGVPECVNLSLSVRVWSGDLPSAINENALQQLQTPFPASHKLQPQDLSKLFIVEIVALQRPRARSSRQNRQQHKGPTGGKTRDGLLGFKKNTRVIPQHAAKGCKQGRGGLEVELRLPMEGLNGVRLCMR